MPALGTVHTVVICIEGSGGMAGPCPAGQVMTVTQAYVIAPSSASFFDAIAAPFDTATAGAFFGFAFASTIFLWLTALGAGAVIRFVRHA